MNRLGTCAHLVDVLKLFISGQVARSSPSPWPEPFGRNPGNLDVSEALAWSAALPELSVGALPGAPAATREAGTAHQGRFPASKACS